MDGKTIFLNGDFHEEVYMKHREGYSYSMGMNIWFVSSTKCCMGFNKLGNKRSTIFQKFGYDQKWSRF
jgi:hypothetical protein